jgi:hypothetical protein
MEQEEKEKKEDELNVEFKLISREMDKVADVISETLANLGIDNIEKIEITKLPIIFSALSKKIEEKNKKKDFTFAKVRLNPANGYKLLSVSPEASDIKVDDWVCITKVNGLDENTNVPKLLKELEVVENQPLIPPYDEQTKLKEAGYKMSENGHYMSSSIKIKDLDKYLEKVNKRLEESEAEETMEYFLAKFKRKPTINTHSDSNISDEEINKIGELN